MYKYTAGQHFGPHFDDSVRDTVTGDKSEWTLLVYLSGVQDGVEGGEVNRIWSSYPPIYHFGLDSGRPIWYIGRIAVGTIYSNFDVVQTLFYKQQRGKPQEVITPPLTRGTALLHRWVFHGHT